MFCNASGSKMSTAKTKIYFSKNVSYGLAENIYRQSGFDKVNYRGKYLGTSLLNGRIMKENLNFMVDNVRQKLVGWSVSSIEGRVTLIKSVLAVTLNYIMQTIPFTKSICNELDKITRSFLWGSTSCTKKTLCFPGMLFGSLRIWVVLAFIAHVTLVKPL